MKVIVFVPKGSSFSKYNYRTFEVNMFVGDTLLNVSLEDFVSADFSFKEIIVVDFEKEIEQTKKDCAWYSNRIYKTKLEWLNNYGKYRGLKIETESAPAQ
jgi:hypothetical protein